MNGFSFSRWLGILIKEFIQLRRDRLTFGMIIGVPIMQLLLFGFAINTDPRHLPTAVVCRPRAFTRAYVAAMANSDYFRIVGSVDEREADRLLDRARSSSSSPSRADFPAACCAASPHAAGRGRCHRSDGRRRRDLGAGPARRARLAPTCRACARARAPVDVRVHRRYNPEGMTAYNIVPGLMGVILTMTMVLMTGLAMTRERERGTFENLLSMPVTPVEVMTGKIVPYILVGLIQVTLILLAARWIFDVPIPAACCCSTAWCCSSSARTSRWASPSARWRATSCRPCR